ncbi:MAG: DinB family protein [Bacteroidetes bacterium]|nr:DinB family protein [Bacteroidota bacterium]
MSRIVSGYFEKQFDVMVRWVDGVLNGLDDADFKHELSPGKNNGVWLLGHLVVCDDDFSLYMGKGDILYPDYVDLFGQGTKVMPPEKYPPVKELREGWKKVCEKNYRIYSNIRDEELKEPHALVKNIEEDYFKTKENIIMHWQLHQMYHAGQLAVILSLCGKSKY